MEIERKFKLDAFPEHLPLLHASQVEQGYLSTTPCVRIRSKKTEDAVDYKLCIKGQGTLVREEVELSLDEDRFTRLKSLLHGEMIRKDYRIYQLPDGRKLECSLVDGGTENAFLYAEVEFPSVEEALAFQPPEWLSNEVTEDSYYSMSQYWMRKKASLLGK